MANYYKDKYNRFIDNAYDIYEHITNSYMDIYDNQLLDFGAENIEIGKMQFVRILSYRKAESPEVDFGNISDAMCANLRYCAGLGVAFGYFIVSKDDEIGIYIAIEEEITANFISNMSSAIPDLVVSKGFIPMGELKRLSLNSGIVSGTVALNNFIADKILSNLFDINGIIALIAAPIEKKVISQFISSMSELKQTSNALTNDNMQQKGRSYALLPEIDEFLEDSIKYYGNAREDFWEYCIWVGCEEKQNLPKLGNALKAALNSRNIQKLGKAGFYRTTESPLQQGNLSLPLADYSNSRYEFSAGLIKPSLLAYISTSDLASIVQLPTYSVNGFEVIEMEKNKGAINLFNTDYSKKIEKNIRIGSDITSGIPYTLSLKDLTQHLLITGATGSGKTNTVMKVAKGIYESDISLLIIEPSKKDYWHLIPDMRNLQVFSYGKDAELLRINPLIPEEGTILFNHVDHLMHAFSGVFDMEPPTRFALDGLLKYTYEYFGWQMSEIIYYSGQKFPKIKDMLMLLPEYVESKLPYGEEVKRNVLGSLTNRLTALNTGIIGEAANSEYSISGKELCSGAVLVELDDLSIEIKPFLTMLIMMKVEQYLRHRNASSELQNIVVLEEAHNIFTRISENYKIDARKMASDTFSNMISQIREYGTGIIIADQGASQINDTAISNTKIKIIHSTADMEDVNAIAFALNLSDVQKRVLPTLNTGEAIVSVRGSHVTSRINIDKVSDKRVENIACLFCPNRTRCSNFNNVVEPYIFRQAVYADAIYNVRFDAVKLKNLIDMIAKKLEYKKECKFCLLGRLISCENTRYGEREKRRIIQMYKDVIKE